MPIITSRPVDPLEDGQRRMIFVQELLEEEYYEEAQPGTLKLVLEIVDGRVTTTISYLNYDDEMVIRTAQEYVEDLV